MTAYERSVKVMEELFCKDVQFSLATVKDSSPSIRVVDAYYDDGVFWIVTHKNSNKVREIEANPNAALCRGFHSFKGLAFNAGHPLKEENRMIREKLIKVFEAWYFRHNDESDEGMCYVRFVPARGFFFKDSTGYRVSFSEREAEEFPFSPDIVEIG